MYEVWSISAFEGIAAIFEKKNEYSLFLIDVEN